MMSHPKLVLSSLKNELQKHCVVHQSKINNCGKIVSDFEHVISHHIQHDDFMAALEVLIKQVRKFNVVLKKEFPLVTCWKFKSVHFITK